MINISFGGQQDRSYSINQCMQFLSEYIYVHKGVLVRPTGINSQKDLQLFLKMMQNVLYWVENERDDYIRNQQT